MAAGGAGGGGAARGVPGGRNYTKSQEKGKERGTLPGLGGDYSLKAGAEKTEGKMHEAP